MATKSTTPYMVRPPQTGAETPRERESSPGQQQSQLGSILVDNRQIQVCCDKGLGRAYPLLPITPL